MSSDGVSSLQTRMQLAETMKEEEKEYHFRGVLYPTLMCPEETLKGLDQFQARPDDIMLVAYPKCGESPKENTKDVERSRWCWCLLKLL